MRCCWEFKAAVHPCQDLEIVGFILRGQDAMSDEEINEDDCAIGLELPVC